MQLTRYNTYQFKCVFNLDELYKRNIDINKVSYHSISMRKLFKEITTTIISDFNLLNVDKMPLIIEAVPCEDNLTLIIAWIEDTDEVFHPSDSTLYEANITSNPIPVFLDNNEEGTKNSIISTFLKDIYTAIGSGNVYEKLTPYLTKDFLDKLKDEIPSVVLEIILSSFFSDAYQKAINHNFLETKKTSNGNVQNSPFISRNSNKELENSFNEDVLFIYLEKISDFFDLLNSSDLMYFKGHSTLLKIKNNFSLCLYKGRLPKEVFLEEINSIRKNINGYMLDIASFYHLCEMNEVLIKDNAINSLLKK